MSHVSISFLCFMLQDQRLHFTVSKYTLYSGNRKEKFIKSGRFLQDLFIKQSGHKPERRIIKAYEAVVVQFCPAVIPRTEISFFQKRTGEIFHAEDPAHIDQSPLKSAQTPEHGREWTDAGGHSVDWKHPDGRLAHQFKFPAAEGI